MVSKAKITKNKKIGVIGAGGYVGITAACCFAELGFEVHGIEIDQNKVTKLNTGVLPIFEKGMREVLKKNLNKKLFFSTDSRALKDIQVVFIAVPTPSKEDGSVNLDYLIQAIKQNSINLRRGAILVIKSTVPPYTERLINNLLKKIKRSDIELVYCPEFLKEGTALSDFMNAERVILGGEHMDAVNVVEQIFSNLNTKIIKTNFATASLIKYASNSFLATSISFINFISQISEYYGGDINTVSEGMKADKRIGKYAFLSAGVGYGGSCFPKDVKELIWTAKHAGIDPELLQDVEKINKSQKKWVIQKVERALGNLRSKKIGIWGLAFKPGTDDLREAPAIEIINTLLKKGANVSAYDPVAEQAASKLFPKLTYCPHPIEAAEDRDAVLLLTEWPIFHSIDLKQLKKIMRKPVIIDGRNALNRDKVIKSGIKYIGLGR